MVLKGLPIHPVHDDSRHADLGENIADADKMGVAKLCKLVHLRQPLPPNGWNVIVLGLEDLQRMKRTEL